MTPAVAAHADEDHDEDARPAWSLTRDAYDSIKLDNPLPDRVDRAWALGGATGKGVKVCILDSGIEAGHPLVGELARRGRDHVDEDGNGDRDRGHRRRPLRPRHRLRGRRARPSPPRPSCTRCACSAPASPARARCCSPA